MIGFEGHADRNASELLRGVVLSVEIEEEELVAEEDEVHDALLIGLTVVDKRSRARSARSPASTTAPPTRPSSSNARA